MSKSRKIIGGSVAIVLVLAAVVGAFVFRQRIVDQIQFWNYEPDAAIVQLADRSQLSDNGRFYFYLARPQLASSEDFNDKCRSGEQTNPILGCYVASTDNIYVYDIQDAELDGIKEVTLAHEMLHVAWTRLSEEQKSTLEPLLDANYERLKTPELTARMQYYSKAEPGAKYNELHSILATEFSDIGDELERYYANYFTNRAAVVSLYAQYSQKFTSIQTEADALSDSLAEQKQVIDQKTQNYETAIEAYNQRVQDFNSRAAQGYFTTEEAFRTERGLLESQATALGADRQELEGLIAAYNEDVTKLQALGRKMDQLTQSLDSTKAVD